MALCFENLLSNGKAALVQLLRKMQRRGKRPRESTYHSYGHVQLIQKKVKVLLYGNSDLDIASHTIGCMQGIHALKRGCRQAN